MKPTLLILAAGMGSRYGRLKQLDPVGPSGETILEYSIHDAVKAGFGKIVFVIRKSIEEEFKSAMEKKLPKDIQVEYVYQEIENLPEGFEVPAERTKPWGTSHAVMMAKDVIKEPFVVINADDFYGAEAFQVIAESFSKLSPDDTNHYFMVGYKLGNTLSDFGSVSRGVAEVDENNYLKEVNERTHIEKTESGAKYKDGEGFVDLTGNEIVSMNFFGFTPSFFKHCELMFKEFLKGNIENPKAEFFLALVINHLIETGKAKFEVLMSNTEWFGVTYIEDKPFVEQKIKDLVAKGSYPESLWTK